MDYRENPYHWPFGNNDERCVEWILGFSGLLHFHKTLCKIKGIDGNDRQGDQAVPNG
jgi:hypothetical protein